MKSTKRSGKDQLKQLWEKYSLVIVGAAVLVVSGDWRLAGLSVVGIAQGGRNWHGFEAAASSAGAEDKHAEAAAAFAKIATEGTAGLSRDWRGCARLPNLAATDRAAAVKLYDAVSRNPMRRDFAATCALAIACVPAFCLVDTVPYDEIQRRLEPLAHPSGIFRHSAREMLALSSRAAKRQYDGDPPLGRARFRRTMRHAGHIAQPHRTVIRNDR